MITLYSHISPLHASAPTMHPSRRFVLRFFPILNQFRSFSSSPQELEHALTALVESKNYVKIPDFITNEFSQSQSQISNPFKFLSSFPHNLQIQMVDEMLQSFIPIRPRYKPKLAYSYLLSYILQTPQPFPLALAVLQRTLRSGCLPVPQTHVLLSSAWLNRRQCGSESSVAGILLEMQAIGYYPDCGTCGYIVSCLCAVDELAEAVNVVKGMSGAGCIPDLNCFGVVISAMCRVKRTVDGYDLMKEMVVKYGLTPDHGTVVKLLAALRRNKEIWRAVEVIEFLEKEGNDVGFESYEMVIEGCLERREYVLAGKVVMGMTERGFIPYIKVRQKIIDGLASVDEWKMACAVRQRFAKLKS
ncbi:pentatricopeptide repeat-containing protein At1g06270-like [Vicia villosa]|uniref:pentatricopeptide repeat-containing protein At1g06270-like n=1 Tax=Vicia villosa TaxID=3911 RepID=UPI00273C2220|nr:pentatricopeptide repeat-containing protein At1g06270-like [Vicia villosa]